MGFSVFPLNWKDPETGYVTKGYKEEGYAADAFTNFLALLGWSPGNDDEIFSLQQLCELFTMERVGKSGTKFDIDKAKWYNEQYLRALTPEQMQELVLGVAKKQEVNCTAENAMKIGMLMQERITFPDDIWREASYFFHAPESYDDKIVRKKWNEEVVAVLEGYQVALADLSEFTAEEAKSLLSGVIDGLGFKMGKVMQAVRMSITGVGGGPDLMGVFEVLGPKEIIRRIDLAIEKIEH